MAIKSKSEKRTPRERRKFRIRKKIFGTEACPRLSVFKSAKYTYAQLISDETGKTIVSASSLEKEVQTEALSIASARDKAVQAKGGEKQDSAAAVSHKSSTSAKSISAAFAVGLMVAKRASEKSITKAVFDRNGFLYHGRIQAVAEGARKAGIVL